jgi:hypothetical protein
MKIRREGKNLSLSLLKRFNVRIKNLKEYETPTGTGVKVMKPKDEETKLTKSDQKVYRSVVKSLVYIVKYSRLYMYNCVRVLSKVTDEANSEDALQNNQVY